MTDNPINNTVVDQVFIGGNHLAAYLLDRYAPTLITSYEDAQEKCGQAYADVWVAWKAIRDMKEAHNG